MLSSQLEGGFGTLSLEVMKLTSLPVTPSPPSHKMASLRRPYIDKPLGFVHNKDLTPVKRTTQKWDSQGMAILRPQVTIFGYGSIISSEGKIPPFDLFCYWTLIEMVSVVVEQITNGGL